MPLRFTDASSSAYFLTQIASSRQRLATAQEQISSGKRINRPSDDPIGAGVVIRTRTAQAEVEQFQRNTGSARDSLLAADDALDSYELTLDRVRSLLTAGGSDNSTQEAKNSLASELDSLRSQMLSIAGRKNGDQFLFGGTRQDAPPYDNTGAPAATPTTAQLLQIDPNSPPLATGVTADSVFEDATGTIFAALTDAAAALRGTGDAVADRATVLGTLDRLKGFGDQALNARTQIGTNLQRTEAVGDQLTQRALGLEATLTRVEGADFVESAVQLTEAQRALEAILQTKASTGRTSLIDLLG